MNAPKRAQRATTYHDAKIYKLVSKSHPELVYYGSTTRTLQARLKEHERSMKQLTLASAQVMRYNDYEIQLLEILECATLHELHAKEASYIEQNDCVNYTIPGKYKQYKNKPQHVQDQEEGMKMMMLKTIKDFNAIH